MGHSEEIIMNQSQLEVAETSIPGLFEIQLVVHGDQRGWFKENWQKAKMEALGLPSFEPVQNNISFNVERGVTRGIHAEPWDKFISMGNGEVFAAIVDLRQGKNFGRLETFHLTPAKAIYVPQGCANAFQTLTTNAVYTYLVNAHWSPATKYTMLNLGDPTVNIQWPIPLAKAILSEKDKAHPTLDKIKPMLIQEV